MQDGYVPGQKDPEQSSTDPGVRIPDSGGVTPPGGPQYGGHQSAQPQYSQPQSAQPQYSQPQSAQPQYGQPQYVQPQYGGPQYGQPQYGQPQYGQPQYGGPQYGQPGRYYPPQNYAAPLNPRGPARSRAPAPVFKEVPPIVRKLVIIASMIGITATLVSMIASRIDRYGGAGSASYFVRLLFFIIPGFCLLYLGSYFKNKPLFFGLGLILVAIMHSSAPGNGAAGTVMWVVCMHLISAAAFHYFFKGRGIRSKAKTVLAIVYACISVIGAVSGTVYAFNMLSQGHYSVQAAVITLIQSIAAVCVSDLVAAAAAIYSVRTEDPAPGPDADA